MTEGTIGILGQKLSYPTTWHGKASVLVVGSAITIITVLLVGWATPEVLRGIKGLNSTSEQQQTINSNFVTELN